MKKLIIILIINFGIISITSAQMSLRLDAAPAIPTGNFANIGNLGYGFGITGEFNISENAAIGASVQHYKFGFSPVGFNVPGLNFAVTPITASLSFFPAEGIVKPYLGLNGGVYNFKLDSFIDVTRSYFGVAPKVGILYPINNKIDFHAEAAYNVIFVNEAIPFTEFEFRQNITFIPINFGVAFKF